MKFVVHLVALLLLFSCSSVPPKSEAIHDALTTDMAIRIATQNCTALGGEYSRDVQRGQIDWWSRNSSLVLAADYGLLALNWDRANEKAEQQRAIHAIQILESIQDNADQIAQKWTKDTSPKGCESFVSNLNKNKYDLDRSSSMKAELVRLNDKRIDISADADAARSINSRYRKYGRSLFVVEKALKDAGCSKPKIALLRNSWPLEVYDALCSQQDYVLVTCDWGRCEIKH